MSSDLRQTAKDTQLRSCWLDSEIRKILTARSFKLDKLFGSYRKKRGTAAVEFALVAPLFFFLLFGMIEFGRCVLVQQVLTNASREGARRAALLNANDDEVRTAVQGYLTSAAVSGAAIDIDRATNPNQVSVAVAVDFSQVTWLPVPASLTLPGCSEVSLRDLRLSATSVMRKETF